ncbi:RC-LH1 core complex protein PufX [uncultured Sulfitobacter sp.]|uniref:RC-LH1 core complex protein PufX n=1 Tax=uncultured Sulfitobacter sp. TaxID=191468 RepID=UPI0026277F6C|nr:RC-LH1 core complex protein PufX [uncultured Sulfitobacter sp.]
MSDNNDYLRTGDQTFRLRADVFLLMMKGAGYAAIVCVGFGLFMWALYGIGLLLPDEAREADDPTPFSAYEAPLADTTRT